MSNNIKERIDRVIGYKGLLDTTSYHFNSLLTSMNDNISNVVEKGINELKLNISVVNKEFPVIDSDITNTNNSIDAIEQDIDAIETQISTTKSDITTINNKLITLREKLSNISYNKEKIVYNINESVLRIVLLPNIYYIITPTDITSTNEILLEIDLQDFENKLNQYFFEIHPTENLSISLPEYVQTDFNDELNFRFDYTGTIIKTVKYNAFQYHIINNKANIQTIEKSQKITDYMTIEALEDGLTVSLTRNTTEYCIDKSGEWVTLSAGSTSPAINKGQTISFKATNPSIDSSYGIGTFTISKQCNLKGNCMSLLYGGDASNQTSVPSYAFYKLFYNCTTIKEVSKYFLLATTLAERCYAYMFPGCTSLTTAPELPATTLAYYCYDSMFQGCTSLTTVPELPAMTLANNCYLYMFYNCTSLTTVPELPATTLALYCYRYMFNGCTSLTTAPELPATTLAYYCYSGMFYNCTSLTSAPELPATTLASYCYYEMFRYCTSLTTTPELPATTLASYCYPYMFQGCSKLNYIKMLATNISASSCLSNWVSGVSSTGTFVKNKNATWNVTGSSGVPSGWTVETV